jgi:hypothetical protein
MKGEEVVMAVKTYSNEATFAWLQFHTKNVSKHNKILQVKYVMHITYLTTVQLEI